MASYSTTFTGTENPLLENGAIVGGVNTWVSGPGDWNPLQKTGGIAQAASVTANPMSGVMLNTSALTVGADQFSRGVVGAESTGGALMLMVRMQSPTNGSCYACLCNGGAGSNQGIFTVLDSGAGAPVETVLVANVAATVNAGDTLELRAVGSTLTLWLNGALIVTRTDSTYASGQPGVGVYSTAAIANQTWESWEGGDFVPVLPDVAGVVESLRIDTSDPWTWSHNQGTTAPKGVLVGIMHGTSSTDHVVSVTYGGVALTRAQRNVDTATEAGAAEWWFRGSGIPTGTQTVSVDLSSGTTDDLHGVSITINANANLEVVDVDGLSDTNAANPSVTLNYGGRQCMAFAAFYSGLTAISSITAGANCQLITTSELAGNFCSVALRQTTPGTADFAIGATAAADDVAYAAVAIGEAETAYVLTADGGSYSLTGTAATPKASRKVSAASASYSLSGTAAALRKGVSLIAGGDSYGLTGVAASLRRTGRLSAAAGSYASTGSAATLDYEGSNLPTLPQAWVDTTMPAPRSGATTHVCTSSAQFATALTNAVLGDIIELQAGTAFQGPFTLPNKTPAAHAGNPDNSEWIVIRTSTSDASLPAPGTRLTSASAALLPKLVAPDGLSAIVTATGAHHFRFIGVEIKQEAGAYTFNLVLIGAGETSSANLPHHIIFDRVYVHGTPGEGTIRGLSLNGNHLAIIDSTISDIKDCGPDTMTIGCSNGEGPLKIVNNYLEASGENVMLGAGDPSITNLVPSDIEVRLNHFFKPLSWMQSHPSFVPTPSYCLGDPWTVKNIFELKNARRVLIDGNIFENNWEQAQNGFAILFTVRNQEGNAPWATVSDITFTNNIVRHTASGVNILGTDGINPSQFTERVLIKNNLFVDVDATTYGGSGHLFQILHQAKDITMEHNTGFPTGAVITADGDPSTGVVFRNNISDFGIYGVTGTGTGTGTPTLNNYFPGAIFERNVLADGDADTYVASYPPNNYLISSLNGVGFVDLGAGNYRLTTASAYHNAATDGTDIGVDIDALNAALGEEIEPPSIVKRVLVRRT